MRRWPDIAAAVAALAVILTAWNSLDSRLARVETALVEQYKQAVAWQARADEDRRFFMQALTIHHPDLLRDGKQRPRTP